MKIWRFHEYGPIENLQIEESPTPDPGPGEALVRVHYAAINPADRHLVANQYPRAGKPPLAVGRDGAGTIVHAPAGSGFEPGERVMFLRSEIGVRRDGTLAEFVAVPAESLVPIPNGWSDPEAAAGGLVQLTAWQALVEEGGLDPAGGDPKTVLVSGASGGVGSAAIMQARAMGARVVALTRGNKKDAELLALGADFVFDLNDPKLIEKVKGALDGTGVDIVVDNLSGPYMDTWIALTGFKGRICTVGMLAGVDVKFNIGKMIFKRIHICGIAVGSQTPAEARHHFGQLAQVLESANARPPIDKIFPFEKVQEAFARLQAGPIGKVVIGPINRP